MPMKQMKLQELKSKKPTDLISFAEDRETALKRMSIALDEMLVDGIRSNIPLQQEIMKDAKFQEGGVNIHYLEKKLGL